MCTWLLLTTLAILMHLPLTENRLFLGYRSSMIINKLVM